MVPYLQITIVGMKRDTLFEHKEFAVTYEETMANAEKYQKLLEPPRKPEKH
jgi:hypothetical protein